MARSLRTARQRRAAELDGYKQKMVVKPRQKYEDYLRSDWWQMKRRQKINSVGGKCEKCGDIEDRVELHVHHLHYLSLGREKHRDLKVLCEVCHKAEHPDWE